MTEINKDNWPIMLCAEVIPLKVFESTKFLAILYKQRANDLVRLTVRKKSKKRDGNWEDGITWDELQIIKNECLGEDVECIEVYPKQSDVINVSNMRHLWVLDEPCKYRFPKEKSMPDSEAAMLAITQLLTSYKE